MVNAMPSRWLSPSPGSWLARLTARRQRQDGEFDCAVRVIAGAVDGESSRWSYRRSAVDPYRDGDVVTLCHGVPPKQTRLRLRLAPDAFAADAGVRPQHVVWRAVAIDSGATVEVAAAPGAFDA